MSKHTPGPWAVSTRHSESRTIHTVAGDDGPVMSTDSLPDATLIAAAPELLEVVRMVVAARDEADRGGDHYAELSTAVTDAARAAITKAEGSES